MVRFGPDTLHDLRSVTKSVGHALMMTLGTEWDELSIPYTDPRNSEIAMDRAADRCRYVLARIGVAVLNGGVSGGRQVVPAEWLKASFTPAVSMPDGRRYGFHWYLGAVPTDDGTGCRVLTWPSW